MKDRSDRDNHNANNADVNGQASDNVSTSGSVSSKLKAALLGLTPATIFKLTLITSIVALAATIIWRTATQSIHVNISPVNTATVELSGATDLGGIGAGEYKGVEYRVRNQSTKPSYVFVRLEMATPGLYEVVGDDGNPPDGWTRVTSAEGENELIFGYGESGALTPVAIGDEAVFAGRLHCLADAVRYSELTGDDLDLDVHGCLVYGTDSDGGSVAYNTSAESLWQAYVENR